MALHATLKGLKLVKMFDLMPEKSHTFAKEMGEKLGLEMQVVPSAKEAVEGADVVAPATIVGPEDRYIEAEWIKEGAYLANLSVNDYTPGAVLGCDRIVVDSKKQLQVPNAIVSDLVADGRVDIDQIAELGAIVNGKEPGRTRDDERIFISPLGMGIEDLINAHRVYLEARRRGIGQELELWHEPYWT
jgi:ornithine cyclodeaminase